MTLIDGIDGLIDGKKCSRGLALKLICFHLYNIVGIKVNFKWFGNFLFQVK